MVNWEPVDLEVTLDLLFSADVADIRQRVNLPSGETYRINDVGGNGDPADFLWLLVESTNVTNPVDQNFIVTEKDFDDPDHIYLGGTVATNRRIRRFVKPSGPWETSDAVGDDLATAWLNRTSETYI